MWAELEEVEPLLKEQGYKINNPWDVVRIFEEKVAEYAGSKYAIAVDNCTNALFLCLKYSKYKGEVTIPAKTATTGKSFTVGGYYSEISKN
jgi:dTDP-4-amino-4,6-dideoxygalactose transaminase